MPMTRTERGWIGHFCLGYNCLFRRNTLLENNDYSIVVSTVGYLTEDGTPHTKIKTIGCNHYFETMVFHAQDTKWKDPDISREVDVPLKSQSKDKNGEQEANDIHESVVDYVMGKIHLGEIKTIGED